VRYVFKTLCFVAVSCVVAAITALLLPGLWPTAVRPARAAEAEKKKLADNGECYVCHLALKTERITDIHAKEGVGCVKCHGASDDHMQDEMQMTTPDVLWGRRQVDAMCGKCHEEPHEDVEAKVKGFVAKWRGRQRPNGRAVNDKSICTDCHGTHNLDEKKEFAQRLDEWTALFNGRDLTGWKPSGKADWKVKLGRISATPGSGGGDLWARTELKNYLLAVTFRTDGPLHAGVWIRGADLKPGPRVEIFEQDDPEAFTGSVSVPDKGLALINLRKDLFDAIGWNTLSIEVRGPRVAVWLNGEDVGAVCCPGNEKGRIGLHVKGGPGRENAKLSVREVLVRELPEEEEKDE